MRGNLLIIAAALAFVVGVGTVMEAAVAQRHGRIEASGAYVPLVGDSAITGSLTATSLHASDAGTIGFESAFPILSRSGNNLMINNGPRIGASEFDTWSSTIVNNRGTMPTGCSVSGGVCLKDEVESTGNVTVSDGLWIKMGGGAPAGTDCDAAGEGGRLWTDTTNGILYVCDQVGASTGWAQVTDFSS